MTETYLIQATPHSEVASHMVAKLAPKTALSDNFTVCICIWFSTTVRKNIRYSRVHMTLRQDFEGASLVTHTFVVGLTKTTFFNT